MMTIIEHEAEQVRRANATELQPVVSTPAHAPPR